MPDPSVDSYLKGRFAEAISFGDSITIAVMGPNLEIVTLFRWLGENIVEELLENEVINFVYVPGILSYVSLESKRKAKLKAGPGIEHFVGLGYGWNDIKEATMLALKEQTGFKRDYRKHIAKLITKNSTSLNTNLLHQKSIDVTKVDVRGEIGQNLGFLDFMDPDNGLLQGDLVLRYLDIAHANLFVLIASKLGCNDILGNDICSNIIDVRFKKIFSLSEIPVDKFKTLLDFEEIPNFEYLLKTNQLSFRDLINIRNSKDGISFREWFAKLDNSTKKDVIEAYCRANFGSKINSTSSKLIRIALYQTIPTLFTDPIMSRFIGTGLSFVDSFLLNKLQVGWTPKVIFQRLNVQKPS